MSFHGILFDRPYDAGSAGAFGDPACFRDLNLDQIINSIIAHRDEYNLRPFFTAPLTDSKAAFYRQDVFRDLEQKPVAETVEAFALQMTRAKQHLAAAEKLEYPEQQQRWFLEGIEMYCHAAITLEADLSAAETRSSGFLQFREYLTQYVRSTAFTDLLDETRTLKDELSKLKYCILIGEGGFTVKKYESEIDYSTQVERAFEKFKQGAVRDYRVKFAETWGINHIEAKVLEFVARLFPDVFKRLEEYCRVYGDCLDPVIVSFDRQIQFYLAYIAYIAPLKEAGLPFCYPVMSESSKEVSARDTFDLALAHSLAEEKSKVVCNDFALQATERIIVVSGPNQGGKTTFARAFGQLHYLGCLGCPVPGANAQLFVFDRIFTHFEKEERLETLRGKLQDDLVRIHAILNDATARSIIILNEIFTSTTLSDAVLLSTKVLEQVIERDLLCVCVTFLDELTRLEKTVSMVSTVSPDNLAVRTFKIVRKPADGLAYAMAVAEKYHLDYQSLKDRIKP